MLDTAPAFDPWADADDQPTREYKTPSRSAVWTAGPAPCDRCQHQPLCREGYACRDFAAYVDSGRLAESDRAPRREIFKRLLGGFVDVG
jgi:hypothetical protein